MKAVLPVKRRTDGATHVHISVDYVSKRVLLTMYPCMEQDDGYAFEISKVRQSVIATMGRKSPAKLSGLWLGVCRDIMFRSGTAWETLKAICKESNIEVNPNSIKPFVIHYH
jgi:hypothetical protein